MDAESAAASFGEDGEIAASLSGLNNAEGVFLSGDWQVGRVIASDLKEDAAVGATFVSLPRGMEKAGAETETSGNFFGVADRDADGLESSFVFGVHRDVPEDGEVIACTNTRKMRFQDFSERLAAGKRGGVFRVGKELGFPGRKERRFGGKATVGFVFTGKFARFDFAGFDVGLVESVDPDDGAGYGGGNFPAEKFLAKGVGVGQSDADNGLAGFFEGRDGSILSLVGLAREREVSKDTIVAVKGGLGELFAVHGDNTLADFSRGFGNELLEPGAEIEDAGRSDDGDFVAAVIGGDAENGAKKDAGVFVRCSARAAGFGHFQRALEEFGEVHTHSGSGDHTEIGESRVAAADAGYAGEDFPEMVGFGDLLHFGTGVGDGNEAAANEFFADGLFYACKKVLFEDIGFQRAAGFAGNDTEGFLEVELFLQRFNLNGIGGIQNVQFGEARDFAESHAQNFGAEAGAAHAEQEKMLEPGFFYVGGELLEGCEFRKLLVGDGEPAEPVVFIGVAPERGVFLPEPRDLVVASPVLQRGIDGGMELFRELVGQAINAHARTPACLEMASSSCLNGSWKSLTASASSLSVTCFMEMPAASKSVMVLLAPARSSVRLLRSLP